MAHTANETEKVGKSQKFSRLYLCLSLIVLGFTTFLWAYLGAKLQAANADQLVNSYLFESNATFRGAYLPSQHSFLLKWPLFILVNALGATNLVLISLTVLVSLFTVGLFVYVLYRIERRPYVLGTLCLALASVLLLVPAVPYAGALLPVNMAMLATRNLEYVLYIAALCVIVRNRRIKTKTFWLSALLLGLLTASDKLFFSLSLAGACAATLSYALARRWSLVTLSVKWLMSSVLGFVTATAILWLFNFTRLTHLTSQAGLGPYALVHSVKTIITGGAYSVLALLTNFGANPAFDAVVIRAVPRQASVRLLSLSGPAFIINGLIFCLAVWATLRLVLGSILRKSPRHNNHKGATKIALLMSWASLAAIILFAVSDHYYPVDARYLAISLFTGFMVLAFAASKRNWHTLKLVFFGAVLLVSILISLPFVFTTYNKNTDALAVVNHRNDLIIQVLEQKQVNLLIGDYWRVIPAKQQSGKNINVMPLDDCTHPRQILSSETWQPSLKNRSFAYLLSYDQKLTDYPNCSIDQVTSFYGRPNASTVIEGSFDHPKEILLFYDKGIRLHPVPASINHQNTPDQPIALSDLKPTTCTQPTIMNIVAHQDDDLLFLSPDLIHDIASGHCVRTVYLTAGDAGAGDFYWLGRQKGSEAAYSEMLGNHEIWLEKVVKINSNQYLTVATPKNNPNVSLIFMHLPDGNINGQGFKQSHNESLAQLYSGLVFQLHSVDKQSTYTNQQLVDSLNVLMNTYQPAEIRSQSSYAGGQFPDHSDHVAAGRFAQLAYQKYETEHYENRVVIPFKKYIGYPTHSLADNVFGEDFIKKQIAFLQYGKYDEGVCHSPEQCNRTPTYGSYLRRQYTDIR